MTADPLREVSEDDFRDGICAVNAVLVPHRDAAYLVNLIDYLIQRAKRDGLGLTARLVKTRNALAAASTRATVRAGASTNTIAPQPVLPLAADACVGTAEAAEALGITPDTVRWHWRNDNLEGRKVGRQILITLASVEAQRVRRDEKRRRGA